MQTDPIADLLTRIRNASRAKHPRVDVPSSKMKNELARILKEEGYISTYKLVEDNKVRKTLRLFLKYTPDRRSVITGFCPVIWPSSTTATSSSLTFWLASPIPMLTMTLATLGTDIGLVRPKCFIRAGTTSLR